MWIYLRSTHHPPTNVYTLFFYEFYFLFRKSLSICVDDDFRYFPRPPNPHVSSPHRRPTIHPTNQRTNHFFKVLLLLLMIAHLNPPWLVRIEFFARCGTVLDAISGRRGRSAPKEGNNQRQRQRSVVCWTTSKWNSQSAKDSATHRHHTARTLLFHSSRLCSTLLLLLSWRVWRGWVFHFNNLIQYFLCGFCSWHSQVSAVCGWHRMWMMCHIMRE